MKPIRIDEKLYDFAKKFSSELYDGERTSFVTRLERLENLKTKWIKPKEKRVIDLIIHNYKNQKLLFCKPNIHQKLVYLSDEHLKDVFYENRQQNEFGKAIENALRYDTLQEKDAIKIVKHLKLNTCPYCNASLTVVVNKNNVEKPRFQLDHFFPKSKYPFLAISFFNLVPSCGQCNQSKSKSSVKLGDHFHLYSEETPYDVFQFKLDKKSLIEYLLKGGKNQVSVHLTTKNERHSTFVNNHNKTFGIQGLYDTQSDIVEELIWKSQYYTGSRMEEIAVLLGISKESVARMITGNYLEYEDIHKRPLAKFTQDIARDLKLIR